METLSGRWADCARMGTCIRLGVTTGRYMDESELECVGLIHCFAVCLYVLG